jgi:hypothetical protein
VAFAAFVAVTVAVAVAVKVTWSNVTVLTLEFPLAWTKPPPMAGA